MRKIAYWLFEERYRETLLSFCSSEGLGAEDLSDVDSPCGSYVFFITDREEYLARVNPDATPRCLISSSARFSHKCFVINEKLCVQSMRIILDQIHHGGSLWNTISELKFDSSVKECRIGNSSSGEVERIVCFMTRDFIYYCTFSEIEKIRIGFSEMLTNAIEHGNLNITGKEKFEATEAGTYQNLMQKREADPRYKDREVYFRVDFSKERILITIKDEGNGFDVSKIPSPRDADHLMKLHGRGILITRAYFDEVTYSSKGNEVTLLKKLSQ